MPILSAGQEKPTIRPMDLFWAALPALALLGRMLLLPTTGQRLLLETVGLIVAVWLMFVWLRHVRPELGIRLMIAGLFLLMAPFAFASNVWVTDDEERRLNEADHNFLQAGGTVTYDGPMWFGMLVGAPIGFYFATSLAARFGPEWLPLWILIWIASVFVGLVVGVIATQGLMMILGPTLRSLRRVSPWRADGAIIVGVVAVTVGFILAPEAAHWLGLALDCEWNRKLYGSWRGRFDLIASGTALPLGLSYLSLTAWFHVAAPRNLRKGVIAPFLQFFSNERDAPKELANNVMFGLLRLDQNEIVLDSRLTGEEFQSFYQLLVSDRLGLDEKMVQESSMFDVIEGLKRRAGADGFWRIPVGAFEVEFHLEQIDRRKWRLTIDCEGALSPEASRMRTTAPIPRSRPE